MHRPVLILFMAWLSLGCPAKPEIPAPGKVVPRAQLVSIDAPASVGVGQPLALTLTLLGDGAGQSVHVLARQPGTLSLGSAASFLQSSTALANGEAKFVQADLTLGDSPAALLSAPTDGAKLDLKLSTPGVWTLFVELVDAAGAIESVRSVSVLVGDAPALVLELNRLVAGSDDAVRAQLRLSAGVAPKNVKVFAWLQDQHGAVQVLPNLGSSASVLYRGLSADQTMTLLNRPLAVGLWEVHALMYDDSETLIGFGSAGVQVCDDPGTVSGHVTVAGQALNGAGGAVSLTDLDDSGDLTAPVQSDGAFSASVPPGRYLAQVRIPGRPSASARVSVGCGATVPLELSIAADKLPGQPLTASSTRQAVDAETGKPFIYLFEVSETLEVSPGTAETLAGILSAKLLPQTSLLDAQGLRSIWTRNALSQALSNVDYGASEVAGGLAADGLASLEIVNAGKGYVTISFRIIDVSSGTVKWTRSIRTSTDLGALRAAVDSIVADTDSDPEFAAALAFIADVPRKPFLRIGGPTKVKSGTSFPFIALLVDKRLNRGYPDKAILLRYADTDGVAHLVRGFTGDDGVVRGQLVAGSKPGTLLINGLYQRAHGGEETASASIEVVDPDDVVRVTTDKPLLEVGETAALSVDLTTVVSPSMMDPVDVSAAGGTLDTLRLTTDIHGAAADRFTADGTVSTPTVTATSNGHTGSAQLLVRPACHDGVCPDFGPATPTRLVLSAEPTALVTNGTSVFVVADLRVAHNQFADIPLTVTVTGLGTVASMPVVTDANGLARIRYFAPSTGQGTDTIKVTARVAGGLVSATVDLHYQPPCATCPLTITGPDSVKKGATAQFTTNLPATWTISTNLAMVDRRGLVTAGTAGGKTVLTATTTDVPIRTATKAVWVSCTRDEVLGTYTAQLAYETDTASFNASCPRSTAGTLVIGTYPTAQANQVTLDLSWPNGVPNGTCGYNPSNPQFATLGEACDLNYSAAADFSSNNCAYLHYRLERPTANTLTGRFDVWDLQNACTYALGVTVNATK